METLPPVGTRIRNTFNGETFIFTHVDDQVDEVQFDVFLERGGMLTETGRQHFHPNADEEFIVQNGVLKLANGRCLGRAKALSLHAERRTFFATVTTERHCSRLGLRQDTSSCDSFSTCR